MSEGNVIGLAAAAVTFAITDNPQAAGYAYMAGNMIGAADEARNHVNKGPRLNDLRVITSQSGMAVPIVYGKARLSGNIIWSTNIKEVEDKHDHGLLLNFLNPPVSTYTYYQTFAIALCEGPIKAVSKIWANGTLIYNTLRTTSSGINIINQLGSKKLLKSMKIYTGDEYQSVDPVILANSGSNTNIPAYKGTAYIVFEDFDLTNFGGRLPNFEFEVVNSGSVQYYNEKVVSGFNGIGMYRIVDKRINSFDSKFQDLFNSSIFIGFGTGFRTETDFNTTSNQIVYAGPVASNTFLNKTSSIIIDNTKYHDVSFTNTESTNGTTLLVFRDIHTYENSYKLFHWKDGLIDLDLNINYGNESECVAFCSDSLLAITCSNTYSKGISLFSKSDNNLTLINSITTSEYIRYIACSDYYVLAIGVSGTIYSYDKKLNLLNTKNYSSIDYNFKCLFPVNQYQFCSYEYNYKNIVHIDIDCNYDYIAKSVLEFNRLSFKDGVYIYNLTNSDLSIISNMITVQPEYLGNVLTDLCLRSGLTLDQFDIHEVEFIQINSYCISSSMSANDAISILMNIYQFTRIESDGKIFFKSINSNPILTIDEYELNANSESLSNDELIKVDRISDFELPMQISINYIDIDANMQIYTQYARKQNTVSNNTEQINVPIGMSANDALRLTETMLYKAWLMRNSFVFHISDKYIYLNPSDIIKIKRNNIEYEARITKTSYQNGYISITAVMNNANIFDRDVITQKTPSYTETIKQTSINEVIPLDIPLLRDEDNLSFGFYCGLRELNNNFIYSKLFRSFDNGGNYSQIGQVFGNEATTGFLNNKLESCSDPRILDTVNTITVNSNNQLNSVSFNDLCNNANILIVGMEVIQFMNSEQIDNNTYKLSNLLRGRFGTELFCNNHNEGENFTLIDFNSIILEKGSINDYFKEMILKAPSKGQNIDSALEIKFINTGRSQRPLNPVYTSGGRDSDGNIFISWLRRTRVGGNWNNNFDVPIGETTEKYSLKILDNDGSIKRSINDLNTSSYTYTTDEQINDFGSIQTSLKVSISQISDIIGEGYPNVSVI